MARKDIELTPDGDFIIDSNMDIKYVTGDDVLPHMIYIALKTYLGNWLGNEKVGTRLGKFYGQVMDQRLANELITDLETTLNNHPAFLSLEFTLELRKITLDGLQVKFIIVDTKLMVTELNYILEPRFGIRYKVGINQTNEEVMEKAKLEWSILNRG